MKKQKILISLCSLAALAIIGGAAARAQQSARLALHHLNRLAAKADEVDEVNLDGAMLRFAAQFMGHDKNDPDAAKVRAMIEKLQGIYIKNFEFDKPGEYTPADVELVRRQLQGPEWHKMVNVRSKRDSETTEIYYLGGANHMRGLVILDAEPKEFAVVDIVGPIDPEELSELGGHMGIPAVAVMKGGKEATGAKGK